MTQTTTRNEPEKIQPIMEKVIKELITKQQAPDKSQERPRHDN